MSTLLIALLVGIFCLWFIALYIRHRADDHSNDDTNPNNFVTHISAGDEGLDQELIEKFPIMVYAEVKGLKIGKVQLECAVCLNEFQDHELLRLLTNCDHVFHSECIDAWLKSHATCPVCRTVLRPENGSLESLVDIVVAVEQQAVLNASNTTLVTGQGPPNQISINVLNPTAENRPPRSMPGTDGKLPRSHSTGHPSLAQNEAEDLENYTLRLPEEVRKQIEANLVLKINGTAVWPKEESSRIGYRTSSAESEKGDSKRGGFELGI